MAQEKKRRSRPKRNPHDSKQPPHDSDLEAIRGAKQRHLTEHAAETAEIKATQETGKESTDLEASAELAPTSAHPFGHAVNPATGYVDAITGNDADALTAADVEAGAFAASRMEKETGSHDSPGSDGTQGPAGPSDTSDMEAASEELGAAPGQWVFPKLEIPVRRRSGLAEAQAFFEFTRRFSGYPGPQGAMTSASGEHAEGTADTGGTPHAGGTTVPAEGETLQSEPIRDDMSNLENAANAPPPGERQENQGHHENLENLVKAEDPEYPENLKNTPIETSLRNAEKAPVVGDRKDDQTDTEGIVNAGSVAGVDVGDVHVAGVDVADVDNVGGVDDVTGLEGAGGHVAGLESAARVESSPDEDGPSGAPNTINETDEEATRDADNDETQRELH